MIHSRILRSTILSGMAAGFLAACTQGENIASPGATSAGTSTGGGTTGGGTTGGGTTTATCPTGFATGTSVGGLTVCEISGTIVSDLTLPYVSGTAYQLVGRVDVGVDGDADCSAAASSQATLTIEPGVTVFGSSGSDYVVVNRCSEIDADGTQAMPIIFTSENDIIRRAADATDTGGSNISEWGGLVILGRAPINRCALPAATPGAADCNNIIEGVTSPEAEYGGADSTDSSGTLRYVQVRFAGFAINASGNELNGISFGGVGSGTTVEYVQVHNNSDDGVEFFGGTVNVKYLVLTGNDDDSMDTDNGWSGNAQYVLISQRADGGDNAFEMSSSGVAPATNPTIANFTVVGDRSNAFRLNSGHIGRFLNGVVAYGQECFRWEGDAGDGNSAAYGGTGIDPTYNSVLFDCAVALTNESPDTPAAVGSLAADVNNIETTNTLSASFFPGTAETGVTAFTPLSGIDSFFDDTTYIGAFDPINESPTNNWATGWTFALFADPTCPSGTTNTGSINGVNICGVAGVQTADLTLTRGNYYELEGRVDIGVDVGGDGLAVGADPAVLDIEAGAVVFGNSGSDYLVVNRGSEINANGTALNPVVFTSQADLEDTQTNPDDAIGEWGGIVILGRAPINRCALAGPAPGDVDCNNIIEGVTLPEAEYGGATSGDSSGVLRYVQVKFAGFAINASGNELNGISFGGVGDGTTVEYVQVHNNSDDGMEFFGGTVNAKYIVLTGNDDDSLDTDNGWDGAMQYLIITQRALGGDNAMEMSSSGVAPATNPTIANFTIVGDRSNAFRLNSGHIGRFLNGVVAYGQECFNWESDAGDGNNAAYGGTGIDPTYNSVLFDCDGGLTNESPDTPAAVASVAADANNTTGTADTLISTFINGSAEDGITAFTPLSGVDAFFDDTDYAGAVEDATDRWWAGWSCGLEASTPC